MHDQKRVSRSDVVDEATQQRQKAAFEATGALYKSQFAKRAEKVYTKEALNENTRLLQEVPDGYVMYNYRRDVLLHLFEDAHHTEAPAAATEGTTSTMPAKAQARDAILCLLEAELRFNTTILLHNFKNYFAFVHRHWVYEQLFSLAEEERQGDGLVAITPSTRDLAEEAETARSPVVHALGRFLDAERRQCEKLLDLDERNFHAWNHWRWLRQARQRADALAEPGQSAPSEDSFFTQAERAEMDYTTARINQNFSNYSAWHQRALVLRAALRRHGIRECSSRTVANPSCSSPTCATSSLSASDVDWAALLDLLHRDTEMLIKAVYCDPNDQSAWFYAPFLLDVYRLHASRFAALHHGAEGELVDVMDRFVGAVIDLLVEEARLGEDGECSLPFFSLFTLLVRLRRMRAEATGDAKASEDEDAEAADAMARFDRYVNHILTSLIRGTAPSVEARADLVLMWLHDQLVRTDTARAGMYDYLLRKARKLD